jgi:hypothetical protein
LVISTRLFSILINFTCKYLGQNHFLFFSSQKQGEDTTTRAITQPLVVFILSFGMFVIKMFIRNLWNWNFRQINFLFRYQFNGCLFPSSFHPIFFALFLSCSCSHFVIWMFFFSFFCCYMFCCSRKYFQMTLSKFFFFFFVVVSICLYPYSCTLSPFNEI